MARRTIVIGSLLLAFFSNGARADDDSGRSGDAPEDPAFALLSEGSSSLLEPLSPDAFPHVCVAIRAELPEATANPEELVEGLTSAVRRALTARGHFVTSLPDAPASAEEAAMLAAQRGGQATLHIVLRRHALVLSAEATLFRTRGSGLRALASPEVRRVGETTRRQRIDASLMRFFGPPRRLERSTVVARSMPLPGRGYISLGALDFDGDGRVELALVAPDRIDVVRLRRGRTGGLGVETAARLSLVGLRPSPAPSRRPIATSSVEGAWLLTTTSAHAEAFVLNGEAGVLGVRTIESPCADGGFVVAGGCAARAAGRDYFAAALEGREDGAAPPAAPAIFYARVRRFVAQPDGSRRRAEAITTPRGRLSVRIGEARGALSGVGSAVAMADVDADGSPELLTSAAAVGSSDRLNVTRLRDTGTIARVWESEELDGQVFIAGAADLDGDGAEELLAVEEPPTGSADTHARLWVVR